MICPTLGAAVTMGYNGQLVATTQKRYICTVQYNLFPLVDVNTSQPGNTETSGKMFNFCIKNTRPVS